MFLHRRQHRVPVQAAEGVPQIQDHKSSLGAPAGLHLGCVAQRLGPPRRPDPKLARAHGLGQQFSLGSSKAFACQPAEGLPCGHRAKPAVLLP